MALIIIGGKNDRILFIISPTERMSHPDMRSVCIRDILLEAPGYMTDSRLKISLPGKKRIIETRKIAHPLSSSNIKATLPSYHTKGFIFERVPDPSLYILSSSSSL